MPTSTASRYGNQSGSQSSYTAALLRKAKTASGATAAQIEGKTGGGYRILDHLGSAHTNAEAAAVIAIRREKLHPDYGVPCWYLHHYQLPEPPL